MMPKAKYIIGTTVLLAALVSAGFFWSQPSEQVRSVQAEQTDDDTMGPLDGMTFSGVIGSQTEPNRTKDKFVFSKGKFASTECVRICGYHAGSYFVRERDGKTEFLSVSRCTYKDAKIEWRGTIHNGVVKGESIWTVNRWYRTVEKKLLFEGRLVEEPTPVAGK